MNVTKSFIAILLLLVFCTAGLVQEREKSLEVIHISDHVIKVKSLYVELIAINTRKGIVILNSLWSNKIAGECRRVIEKTFNRSDFAYLIYLSERVDFIGGSNAFPEAQVIGHEIFDEETFRDKQSINAALEEWKDFWRWKVSINERRIKDLEPGTQDYNATKEDRDVCQRILRELSEDYNLVFPTITFKDKLTLDMGDLAIKLYYFGIAGNLKGNIIAVIPEDKVMFTGLMVHAHSLAPRFPSFLDGMDIQKWLKTYDSIFEENDLEIAVLGNDPRGPGYWSINRIHLRHEYIRMLWEEVKNAVSEGATLEEMQDRLSLDKKFSFVKEWPVHKNNEDAIRSGRRSHAANIESVFLNLQQVAAKEVYLTLEESGLEAAIEKFKEIQQNPSDYYFDSATFFTVGNKLLNEDHMAEALALFKMSIEYNPDETAYNRMGYALLGKELTDNAIEFFKLGIKAFPSSANLYDSLGEAYMKNGDNEQAIKNYRKSLELNPDNQNAVKMLKKLKKSVVKFASRGVYL